MGNNLKDKVIAVIDDGSGIVAAIGEKVHSEGAQVAVVDLNLDSAYAFDVYHLTEIKKYMKGTPEDFGFLNGLGE
jgi:NAD(P)-dependent dehydrogenase (short-subunit alcohol dehydrogenase family)